MKKMIAKLLCVMMIACMLLTLAACGKDGTYVLKEVSAGGMTVTAEDAGMDPDDFYVEWKSNGTAVICIDGKEEDMEWKDGEIWPEDDEDDVAEYEFDDDELIIEIESMEMIFVKD